jgi:hypothetical protein
MKRCWKIFRWVGLVLLLVGGYSVYRIGFGKPFTIFDWHSGKLATVGQEARR